MFWSVEMMVQTPKESVFSEVTKYLCLDHGHPIRIRVNLAQGRMHRTALIVVQILIGRSRSKRKYYVTLGDTNLVLYLYLL